MRNSQSSSKPRPALQIAVLPLKSSKVDGTPYQRFKDVENEIRQSIAQAPSTWCATSLKSETLVHLIRLLARQGERDVLSGLVRELGRRIGQITRDFAKGFDPETSHEIAIQVMEEIDGFIFAKVPCRQSEFLEIAFREATKRRVLNQVDKREGHPRVLHFSSSDEGSETPSVSVEMLPANTTGPPQCAIGAEGLARLRSGLAAIRDPRHREAVILHYLQGWPIFDKNTDIPTLCTHFGISARQIQNWMVTAFAQMRDAMGDVI